MKSPALAALAAFAVLCGVAEAAVAFGWVSPLALARPSHVIAGFANLLGGGLLDAFLKTLGSTLVAIGIAVMVGIPAGFVLYLYPLLGRAYESWLAALFAAPLVLLYPLFLVLFGRSFVTVIAMGTITGMIPVILNTRIGLASVPRHMKNVGVSFNCTPAQQFWKVLFPAATPTIFTGIRLGLIYALVNIIGIEFLINFGGLGRIVSETYDRFDIPGMYAAILCIVLVSAMVFFALARIEKRVRPL